MQQIRTFIVDDEAPAREGVRRMLDADPEILVVGEYGRGSEAADAVNTLKPDLLLLDVQMPDLDGFACLSAVEEAAQPVVIFLTAYEKYAVQAFEARAADYILKPFSDARFRAAIDAAKERLKQRRMSAVGSAVLEAWQGNEELAAASPGRNTFVTRIMIRAGDGWKLFPLDRVHWIEGADYYARVHTSNGSFITRESLQRLSDMLDPSVFVRVHRSAIVNINHIEEIHPLLQGRFTLVLQNGARIPLSRRRRPVLEAALGHDL